MFLKELMYSIGLAALLEPKEKTEITVVNEVDRRAKRQRDKEIDETFNIPDINEFYIKQDRQEPVIKYFINVQEEEDKRIITISSTKIKGSVLGIPHSDMIEAIDEVKRLKDYYNKSNFVVETHIDLLG